MEKDCRYVSYRGILQSCDIKPDRPHHSEWSLPSDMPSSESQTYFLYAWSIPEFMEMVLPKLEHRVILVCGGCDETIDDRHCDLADHPMVKHWFAQNCVLNHPKITKIPVGLNYHSLAVAPCSWGEIDTPETQEEKIEAIRRGVDFRAARPLTCYSNFHFYLGRGDRQDAMDQLEPGLMAYEPCPVSRAESLTNQAKHYFVASPAGVGLDCHRTWEALLMGCIPIVKSSGMDDLYNDLPVLIVPEWKNITLDLLKRTSAEISFVPKDLEKLTLKYWVDLMKGMQ